MFMFSVLPPDSVLPGELVNLTVLDVMVWWWQWQWVLGDDGWVFANTVGKRG